MRLLHAGLLTVGILSASRVAGVLRESAVATVFGVSANADVAVLLLSLPDWIAGGLAVGAITYVLVPHWARAGLAAPPDPVTRRMRTAVALLAAAVALSFALAPQLWIRFTAPFAANALADAPLWPIRLLSLGVLGAFAAAWLQAQVLARERWLGVHGANLVLTLSILLGLAALGLSIEGSSRFALIWLAVFVVGGHALRAFWLWRHCAGDPLPPTPAASGRPTVHWFAASLAVGLPYLLPLIVRSLAAQSAAGDVAVFSYAWKLVDLPLSLVLQWLGLLALPAMARAHAARDHALLQRLLLNCLALSWCLASAAVVVLFIGRNTWTHLLFGWGGLNGEQLRQVGAWAAWGALSLPAQAVLAVMLAYCAAIGQLRQFAWAALVGAAALACLLLSQQWLPRQLPAAPMLLLVASYTASAAWVLKAACPPECTARLANLCWPVFVLCALACVGGHIALARQSLWVQGVGAALGGALALAFAMWQQPALRTLLRR